MTMTKEQYIEMRASGGRRQDINKDFFGNDKFTFKIFLEKVGLISLEEELIAVRDYKQNKTNEPKTTEKEKLPFEPSNQIDKVTNGSQGRGRKMTFPHVNKEFIEAAFAVGKSAGQIEREEGMNTGTIFTRVHRFGIINPNTKKKADVQESIVIDTKQDEVMHESPEMTRDSVESVQESEDTVIEQLETEQEEVSAVKSEAEPTKFVYFQIPIIKGYEVFATATHIDFEQHAAELFVMLQRYTQLLHSQMETFIVEGDPADHVQKFIQKHNTIHINKQIVT